MKLIPKFRVLGSNFISQDVAFNCRVGLKGKMLSRERGLSVPVDLIRTVAIVGVILLHSANDLTNQQMNWFEIYRWTTVDVYQSLGRMGVPLFIMLTGALLLQPSKLNEPVRVFFKKRVARLGLAFTFWSAIYFLWDFLVEHQAFTANAVINGVLNGPYYQFWYLYMLAGLYLITPIVRVVIAHADRNLIKYFIALWFLGVAIIPLLSLLTPYQFDSNVFTLTGYVGYFVLGTFLLTVKIQRSKLAILIAVGTALTAIGTYLIAWTVGGGEMYYFQEYLSPTMILASATLFLLLNTYQQQPKIPQIHPLLTQTLVPQKGTDPDSENLPKPNSQSPARKLLKLISENTLPLFLLHVIVLETIQRGYLGFALNGNVINSIIGVPLMTVIVLFVSLGIVLVLKKVPIVKILIG